MTGHTVNVNGVADPAKNLSPETVSIIDVAQYPPKGVVSPQRDAKGFSVDQAITFNICKAASARVS
jgi:hypothetical protein